MWIICAGGKRSGSTLQYNILSKIVEEANLGKRISHFSPNEFNEIKNDNIDYKGYKVIKTHQLYDELKKEIDDQNAIVFHCFRDIRDVVVSYINKGWIKHDHQSIKNSVLEYLALHNIWRKAPNIISRKYENFAFNLKDEIKFITNQLKIKLNSKQINAICKDLNIESLKKSQKNIDKVNLRESYDQKFHKETLLHSNHINDGAHGQFLESLSNYDIALIESIAYKFIMFNDYKFHWTNSDLFVSYSQHADDYISWQLLNYKPKGVIAEIGAFDGIHLSNSFSFSQIGWQSICVEPNPIFFKYLKAQRRNSINVNSAIVDDKNIEEIEFFAEEIGVLSGCNYDEEDIKRRYLNRGLAYNGPKKMKVKAQTLTCLFEDLSIGNSIDIISIDVEGFEMQVLKGLDLNKFNVSLFIVEANTELEKQKILDFFKEYPNYLYLGNNYQNLFFQRKDTVLKRNLRSLEFKKYIKAKQEHPVDNSLSLDSVEANFSKSKEAIKFQKYFGLI